MDDDRKKSPRKGGPAKPAGPAASAGGGKPVLAKPRADAGPKPSDVPRDAGSAKPVSSAVRRAPQEARSGEAARMRPGARRAASPMRRDRRRDASASRIAKRARARSGRQARFRATAARERHARRPRARRQAVPRPAHGRMASLSKSATARRRSQADAAERRARFRAQASASVDRPVSSASEGRRGFAPRRRPRKPFRSGQAPPRGVAELRTKPGERIAKRLARAGIASRRDAEELIAAGRVKVNGKMLASPAFNVMRRRHDRGRRHDHPADRADAAVPVPQAGRRGDHQPRSGRPQDGVRRAAGRSAAADDDRPARHQHRGPAAARPMMAGCRACWNCRRPAGCGATACACTARSTRRRCAGLKDGIAVDGVFYGSIEATLDREQGIERLADDRPARRQEPRGQEHPRRARPRSVAADPHFLRTVPARRTAGRPCPGDQGQACCATSSASG